MSKKQPRQYVVRTFNPATDNFFVNGTKLESLASFAEETLPQQFQAVAAIAAKVELQPSTWLKHHNCRNLTIGSNSATSPVEIVSFTFTTGFTSQAEIRPYRSAIREVIKTWAEKCRVVGLRGFRANAIKTPAFERDPKTNTIAIKFEVILGTVVFYSSNHMTVGMDYQQFSEDIQSLKKHIIDATNGSYGMIFNYKHSSFGDGYI